MFGDYGGYPSAADRSNKRQNLNPPYIASHDRDGFALHVVSEYWGWSVNYNPDPRQQARRPTAHERRLLVAHAEVKRRIDRINEFRSAAAAPGYLDAKSGIVTCRSCRTAWLGRGGGTTVLAECDDGGVIGFDVCDPCAADLKLIEAKVREAIANPQSPARLSPTA